MSIQKISLEQLRRMGDQEGLILQGCGGDLQDWVDGINVMLAEDGVFKKGAASQHPFSLSLIPGVDSFRKLTQQEIAQEQGLRMEEMEQ